MHWHRKTILLFWVSMVCLNGDRLFAQQANHTMPPNQYRAVQWTMKDRLSAQAIHTMIKDAKGFIWIGSHAGGFCRFDGAKFKKYLPERNNRNTINSDQIISFTEDSLNNIWITTEKGISRYDFRADTFTNFSPFNNSETANVLLNPGHAIVPIGSTKDTIFCMEPGALLTAFDIRTLKRRSLAKLSIENDTRVEWNTNKSFFDTRSKSIWKLKVGHSSLEQIFLDGKTRVHSWPCFRNYVNDHRHDAEDMKYDPKRNSIWVHSGDGLLEFSLVDHQFRIPRALNQTIKLNEYDRDVGIDIDIYGRVWFATKSHGLLIYDPKKEIVRPLFSDNDPQKKAGDGNLHIYCDRDGIVWTTNYMSFGIYQLLPFNYSVKRYPAKPGIQDSLSNGYVITIIPAAQNKMWIGTLEGMNVFDPATERFELLQEKDLPGIRGKAIVPVHIDTVLQKAWVYAASDTKRFYESGRMYEMDVKTRQCRQITFRDGAKQFDTILFDYGLIKPYKNGILFFADPIGLFEIKDGSLFADLLVRSYSRSMATGMTLEDERRVYIKPYNALPNFTLENKNGKWEKIPHMLDSLDWVFMLYNKEDQTYWTSFDYKLVHYDIDFREIKTYTEKEGYNGLAYEMILDDAGNLWFVNVLNEVGRLNTSTGIITLLSETDGYITKNFDWATTLVKDASGNLYFGTGTDKGSEGLDRIYPGKYVSAATSSVYLLSLTINQKPFPLPVGVNNLEELSLRYNQNTISIETGIIDFHANGKGHIRYKLKQGNNEGDWQYGPAYYTIRYEKLAPGKYELVLQASNAGNEFNSLEKRLVINIDPPFWQTWWFRILVAVFLLSAFYAIYRWRTATLRKQKRVLEQTVKERTAEVVEEKAEIERQKDIIQTEKEKSDELLLNILPSEVAQELKEKGYTTAKSFDEVTVLFSDIKGFTNVAERLTAQELVKEIDTYFSAFDNIILKYGLEKIKTIGDAYIAAGGLPENNAATAQNVIEAAIAMQKQVEKLKQERITSNKPYFELRIGIHTGPVVAGVVGIKKFQYDIWGDTVNLAARMEQSGVPGKINISEQTYELVKQQFNCVHRGKIEAKNKGDVDMYFVE